MTAAVIFFFLFFFFILLVSVRDPFCARHWEYQERSDSQTVMVQWDGVSQRRPTRMAKRRGRQVQRGQDFLRKGHHCGGRGASQVSAPRPEQQAWRVRGRMPARTGLARSGVCHALGAYTACIRRRDRRGAWESEAQQRRFETSVCFGGDSSQVAPPEGHCPFLLQCYYIGATDDAATKIINEVSKPLAHHIPVEKICEKLKKKDSQICELKYGECPRLASQARPPRCSSSAGVAFYLGSGHELKPWRVSRGRWR